MPVFGSVTGGSQGDNLVSNALAPPAPETFGSQIVLHDGTISPVSGTLAVTAGDATCAASGATTPPTFTGTIAVTLAGATSGLALNLGEIGTLVVTAGNATSSIAAWVGEKGSLGLTAAGATSAIAAALGEVGTLVKTVAGATSGFTGVQGETGTFAFTAMDATGALEGTFIPPPDLGTIDVVAQDAVLAAHGVSKRTYPKVMLPPNSPRARWRSGV